MSFDFDTLYRAWATQYAQDYGTVPTVQRFIGQTYCLTDDPEDITDEIEFILDYAQERDSSDPNWMETYSLPE